MEFETIQQAFWTGIAYGVCGTIITAVILRVLGIGIMLLEWREQKKAQLKPEKMLKKAKFKFGQKVYFVSTKYNENRSKRIQYIQSAIVGGVHVEKKYPAQLEYDLYKPKNFRLKRYKFDTGDYQPPEYCLAASKEDLIKALTNA